MGHISHGDFLLSYLGDMDACQTQQERQDLLRSSMEHLGLSKFMYAYGGWWNDEKQFIQPVYFTTYNETIRTAYFERNAMALDPSFYEVVYNQLPFSWRLADEAASDTDINFYPTKIREFIELTQENGMFAGVSIPIKCANPILAGFGCAAPNGMDYDDFDVFWGTHKTLITWMAQAFHDANLSETHSLKKLNTLKTQIMTELGRGKRTAAIAGKLDLRDRQVSRHIEKTMEILGAKNQPEMVIKSFLSKALDLPRTPTNAPNFLSRGKFTG